MGEPLIAWRNGLKPIDIISALYALVSGLLATAWFRNLGHASWLGPVFLVCAVLILIVPSRLRRMERPWAGLLSAWYPIFCFTLCYKTTALLNQASPIPCLDPWLANLDELLFGKTLCEAFSEACSGTAFAEAMAFSYFSYYFMIPGLSLFLWFRNRRLFSHFVFCTASCFYFFYLIFSLFPSWGPQYYLYGGDIHWKGWFFGPLLTHLLRALESPTGAFPSSHVGIAMIVTVFAWREKPLLGLVFACLSTGLAAAILYGGPHYFVDLPCGMAVALVFLLASKPAEQRIQAFLTKEAPSRSTAPRHNPEKE